MNISGHRDVLDFCPYRPPSKSDRHEGENNGRQSERIGNVGTLIT